MVRPWIGERGDPRGPVSHGGTVTGALPASGTAPRRLFLQYLNPEILSVYGVTQRLSGRQFYDHALHLTRYALLASEGPLIMPASYLFEVPFVHRLVAAVEPLAARGVLLFAGPTPDLYAYAAHKRREYRDEPETLRHYDAPRAVPRTPPLLWIPRRSRSVDHIAQEWTGELMQNEGLWQQVLCRRRGKSPRRISRLETAIASVPRGLDGRAFVMRYATPLLPVELDVTEGSQVSSMISRAYLESYLREFGASILVDTPLGPLDCGVPPIDDFGQQRAVSYQRLTAFFGALELRHYFERQLRWAELCELRERFVFRWLMGHAIAFGAGGGGALQDALLRARYRPPRAEPSRPGVSAVEEVTERIYRVLDAVEPHLAEERPDAAV
jgi:hypothetical protein